MENSEPSFAITPRRLLSHGMPLYQNPYECALKLAIPNSPNPMTGMSLTTSPAIAGALSDNSRNPTISFSDSALNPQQLLTMSSEPRRYSTFWEQPYASNQSHEQLFKQFKETSGSHSSHESLSAASWDFDTYSTHELDGYLSTPPLTESPTTTSSCPRSTMITNFAPWGPFPEEPLDPESSFNSPAPSYVLESNSSSRAGPQRSLKPPQQLNFPWEKLKSTGSNIGSEFSSTPSPTISHNSMQPSYTTMERYSPQLQELPDDISVPREDPDDDPNSSEPYAKLIHRALMSVPSRKMVLKDIYEWFAKNTSKASDSTSKGWQNSIRHNLSMNAAFQKREIPSPGGSQSKRLNVWVLAPEAISGGVKSTTRYRKQGSGKKSSKSAACAPQRVNSGRKGGLAAKKAARRRRDAQDLSRRQAEAGDTLGQTTSQSSHSPITPIDMTPYQSVGSSFYPSCSPGLSHTNLESTGLDYSNVSGVADVGPEAPLFYHDDYSTTRPMPDFALFSTRDADPNMDPFLSL